MSGDRARGAERVTVVGRVTIRQVACADGGGSWEAEAAPTVPGPPPYVRAPALDQLVQVSRVVLDDRRAALRRAQREVDAWACFVDELKNAVAVVEDGRLAAARAVVESCREALAAAEKRLAALQDAAQ